MEGEAHRPIPARLVAPPPVAARLVHPPRRGFFELLAAALQAATRLPMPWSLLALARLLRAQGGWAPFLVVAGVFRRSWRTHGDPFRALAEAITRPESLLPAFGLGLTLLLLSALLEVAAWYLGLPGLAREPEQRERSGFEGILATGTILLAAEAILLAASVSLGGIAGRTWLASLALDGAAPLLGASSLALVVVLVVFAHAFLRVGSEAAIAQAGALGKRPLAAIHDGFALVLRRPGICFGGVLFFAFAGWLVEQSIWSLSALAPHSVPGAAVALFGLVLAFVAGGYLALARLGIFAGAALDEARIADHRAGTEHP